MRTIMSTNGSKGLGFLHQGVDSRQQPPRRSACEHAMVKAQGEVCFCYREELLLLSVPTRDHTTSSHAKHERLFRKGNRSCPRESERAEVCHRGDGAASGVRRQSPLPG